MLSAIYAITDMRVAIRQHVSLVPCDNKYLLLASNKQEQIYAHGANPHFGDEGMNRANVD